MHSKLHQVSSLIVILLINIGIVEGQVTWDAAFDLAPSSFDNNRPRIVTDAQDNPLVIFGKNNDILYSKWNGGVFSQPIKINPANLPAAYQDWMGPDIAARGDTIYVVFKQTPEDNFNSHIWCMRSFNGGQSFDAPTRVESVGNDRSRFPAVTIDKLGHPVVAFMRFNNSFLEARWVVTRSEDFGLSFGDDVLASGWSDPSAEVCDCCPGTLTSDGDVVALLYRDNFENHRDNWAAISNDGGKTFSGGINVDQQNWFLQNCPASGPDGVIVGDTVYTISMNGATIDELVYHGKGSVSDFQANPGVPVTEYSDGLLQNFPRMANYKEAVGMLWRHSKNFNSQLGFRFTTAVTEGFKEAFDTLAFTGVMNADLAVTKDRVFVVWQDNNTGTVKYRAGEYEARIDTTSLFTPQLSLVEIFPNPAFNVIQVNLPKDQELATISLFDFTGKEVTSAIKILPGNQFDVSALNAGLYSGIIRLSNSDVMALRFLLLEK